MQRIALTLALAAAATPALPQSALSPDPLPGATTCAEFSAMDTAGRLRALRAVQPFGDDIGAGDRAAAEQWSGEVAAACAPDPGRPLADAAASALGIE